MASDSEVDTDISLTVAYHCQGTGSQTVFTEIMVGYWPTQKAQSPRRGFSLCS